MRRLVLKGGRAAFTLIELMVALAIAAFTVVALYSLFTMQSRQLLVQDLQMEMHQNLRFAADMTSRSVRIAGFNMPGEVLGPMGYPGTGDSLPAVIPWDADGTSGTDAITVVYADPSLTMDTRSDVVEACASTQLSFRPFMLDNQERLGQISSGQLFTCFDYADTSGQTGYIWSVSADADDSNGVVYIDDATAFSDYANSCTTNLTPVMTCSKAHVQTFYIDDQSDGIGPGSSDHPVLMMDLNMDWPADDDVPVVDNVEDFQVEYCVDDGTGTVDCSVEANWDDTFSTAHIENLWMVRLHFVVRASREEYTGAYGSTRPALANRSGGSSADGYYREVLTTEVTVRNLRHQAAMGL